MKCYHCNEDLTWVGDSDIEDDDNLGRHFLIESTLTCSDCGSLVVVYYPRDKQKKLN